MIIKNMTRKIRSCRYSKIVRYRGLIMENTIDFLKRKKKEVRYFDNEQKMYDEAISDVKKIAKLEELMEDYLTYRITKNAYQMVDEIKEILLQ